MIEKKISQKQNNKIQFKFKDTLETVSDKGFRMVSKCY